MDTYTTTSSASKGTGSIPSSHQLNLAVDMPLNIATPIDAVA